MYWYERAAISLVKMAAACFVSVVYLLLWNPVIIRKRVSSEQINYALRERCKLHSVRITIFFR